GETIVGLAARAKLQKSTLILTTSITAVNQWTREILDKTTLSADDVKQYTGETKEIGPVTVATYQIVTYRPGKKRRSKADGGGRKADTEDPDSFADDAAEDDGPPSAFPLPPYEE